MQWRTNCGAASSAEQRLRSQAVHPLGVHLGGYPLAFQDVLKLVGGGVDVRGQRRARQQRHEVRLHIGACQARQHGVVDDASIATANAVVDRQKDRHVFQVSAVWVGLRTAAGSLHSAPRRRGEGERRTGGESIPTTSL